MPSTATDRLQGLTTSVAVKAPCRVATTGNISLSGLQTIDGVALSLWDRVLVKDQVSLRDNGIYLANSGAWSRALDFDGTRDAVGGTFLKVNSGSLNADSYWSVEGDGPINIGTDDVVISPSSGNITLQAALASSTGSSLVGFQQAGTGAVTRTVQGKLRDAFDIADFVVGGDPAGSASSWPDITTALQTVFTAAAALKRAVICSQPVCGKVTNTISVTPATITSPQNSKLALPIDLHNLFINYTGTRDKIVVDIGTAPGVTIYDGGVIHLPYVFASGALQWPGTLAGNDTGIRLRNIWRTTIHGGYVYGFTKGVEVMGCPYDIFINSYIYDNKYGRVWNTEGSNLDASFTNENKVYGGIVSCTSASSGKGSRFGEVFTWDKVASYRGHNNNRFHDINYELGSGNPADSGIPIWLDKVGALNKWYKIRVEGSVGPIALIDGGIDTGSTLGARNVIDLGYMSSAGTSGRISQVGGACGNYMTGVGCHQPQWHSGDIGRSIRASGTAKSSIVHPDLFYLIAATPVRADAARVDPISNGSSVKAHRSAALLTGGGYSRIGVAVDAEHTKDFIFEFNTLDGFFGRPYFMAYNAAGTLLTGLATSITYGDEPYVKAVSPEGSGNSLNPASNGYTTSADNTAFRRCYVTVREEVAELWCCVVAGSNDAALRSMDITALTTANNQNEAYPNINGVEAIRAFCPLDGDGSLDLVSADPGNAGIHGFYRQGQFVGHSAAVAAAPVGWYCTTAGWLAPAWTVSTTWYVRGQLVTNDTGKIYELVTAGAGAASGGPTGTGTSITDGAAVWKYIGVKAVFTAGANL